MAKQPALPDPNQLEMFPPETLGVAPLKPKRRQIKPVVRTRLSDWFGRKDLLPNDEGRMLPFADDGDA